MCLIVFDWQPNTEHWLTLSANRDEFHHRPALPMAEWPEKPGLYAGKDISQGGTWLGVTSSGRWAALTNIRTPAQATNPSALSRGVLVLDYLTSQKSPKEWLAGINPHEYSPFNLLVGTQQSLYYCHNHPKVSIKQIQPGRYGLSNAHLFSSHISISHLPSDWPKTQLALTQLTDRQAGESLTSLLNRREPWPDDQLPNTGVPKEWESMLSAQFIVSPAYGTRCSSGIEATDERICFKEITWNKQGEEIMQRVESIQINLNS